MKKEKFKNIDWKIIAERTNETNNGDYEVFYKTQGFGKHGYGEIIVLDTLSNEKRIAELINTFGKMLLKGERFDGNCRHFIDNVDGKVEFAFDVIYGEYDDGEKWIQLVPDFKGNTCNNVEPFCDDEENCEEEVVYLNNRPYVTLKTMQNKMKLCRLDKLVWQTFVDDTLDIFNNAWELGYKDGNYKNCALENLYRIR